MTDSFVQIIVDIISKLLNSFDYTFMIVVNISSYLIIKTIDELNGKKYVPLVLKRIISIVTAILIGAVSIFLLKGDATIIFYSSIVSLLSWDYIFKPLLNKLNDNIGYTKK